MTTQAEGGSHGSHEEILTSIVANESLDNVLQGTHRTRHTGDVSVTLVPIRLKGD